MAWTCETCIDKIPCLQQVRRGGPFWRDKCENRLTYQPPPKPPRSWPQGQTIVYQCIMQAEQPLTQHQIEQQTGIPPGSVTYYVQRLVAGGYIHRRQDVCRERRMYHWHSEIKDHHLPHLMRRRSLIPQVAQMTQAGLGKMKIAAALGISDTTVFDYRKAARALGLLED